MNKSSLSMVLVTLLTASGFALAQATPSVAPTPPSDGTPPKTRAEVKSEINNRAGAKVGAPAQGGDTTSGAATPSAAGGTSQNSRAAVKAQVTSDDKSGSLAQGGNQVVNGKAGPTTAERKAAREKRKAARKAKRDAAASNTAMGKGMDTGSSSPVKTAPQ
jgi:hypothetical protein